MTDLASIGDAVTALRGMADLAKSLLGIRDTTVIHAKVAELQTQIMTAQGGALNAQSEQFALHQRMRDLEKQISDLEAWDIEKARYELAEVSPGSFVYELKAAVKDGEPNHWICANCYQERRKSILQYFSRNAAARTFKCHSCGADIRIASSAPAPQNPVLKSNYC